MKNIHLVTTQEKAYLTVMNGRVRFDYTPIFGEPSLRMDALDMHITINEEPKLDEWGINIDNNVVFKDKGFTSDEYGKLYCKKIIMTTNQQLIKAGVQQISMEVLEWYAKNPTHDFVKIEEEFQQGTSVQVGDGIFKYVPSKTPIIYNVVLPTEKTLSINDFANVFKIPKELFGSKDEPTTTIENDLEEFIRKAYLSRLEDCLSVDFDEGVRLGSKWQQENSNVNVLNFEIDALKREIKLLKNKLLCKKN